MLAVSGRGQ